METSTLQKKTQDKLCLKKPNWGDQSKNINTCRLEAEELLPADHCYSSKIVVKILLHLYQQTHNQQVKKVYIAKNLLSYQLEVWDGLPSSLPVATAQIHK